MSSVKDRAKNYTQTFNSLAGKRVLEDLQKIWKSPPAGVEATTLAHLEGQRHVIRYIEAQITLGSKEK